MTQAAVAVHRWFERGEGWAFDPHCARLCGADPTAALNALFDRRLKSPEPGDFVQPVEGGEGVWVGRVERDAHPIDPRVKPGDTPILRAALLPYAPDGEVEERVLVALRQLSPLRPGEDPSLVLDVTLDSAPSRPPREPIRIPAYVPVVAALLAAAVGIALLRPWTWSFSRRGPAEPKAAHARQMLVLLRSWGDDLEDSAGRTDAVVARFFGLLSRPAWAARLDADAHPYHAFVLRLPAQPVSVSDPADEKAVSAALNELLGYVALPRINKPTIPATAEDLLPLVEAGMTYDAWWRAAGRWSRYTQRDERPAKEVRDFVGRFRRPEADFVAAAGNLVGLLARWREPGFARSDAEKHPEQVCHAFFGVLTKKGFRFAQLRPNHPDAVFVDRLPEEAVDDGRIVSSAAELRELLHGLLRHLDRSFNPADPANRDVGRCVDLVGREMDFGLWRDTEGKGLRNYTDAAGPIDAAVSEFAGRFKQDGGRR